MRAYPSPSSVSTLPSSSRRYAYTGDAGLDLRANADVDIAPGERVLIPTGLAIALPDGYRRVRAAPERHGAQARSLHPATPRASSTPITAASSRSSPSTSMPDETIHIERGERIAQLVIQEVPVVELVEVDELDETDRGTRRIRLKRCRLGIRAYTEEQHQGKGE